MTRHVQLYVRLIFTTLLLAPFGCDRSAESELPRVASERVTVSGVGAGGYMAGQLHVAHSATIAGAAIIGAGPYWCAKNSADRALGVCAAGGDFDIDALTHFARDEAAAGRIDTLNHLRNDRVWIFHGRRDETVHVDSAWAAAEFYEDLMPANSVQVVTDVDVGYGMPVRSEGFDAALALLTHLLPDRDAPGDRDEGTHPMREFDQQLYVDAGFSETGHIYVPDACLKPNQCGLHIVLHDCEAPIKGDVASMAAQSGFNAWAGAFDVVVLYPQLRSDTEWCWDWRGVSGPDYAVQSAAQISALKSMIDSLVTPMR